MTDPKVVHPTPYDGIDFIDDLPYRTESLVTCDFPNLDWTSRRARFNFFRAELPANAHARTAEKPVGWTRFTAENWTLSDRRQHISHIAQRSLGRKGQIERGIWPRDTTPLGERV